MSEAKQIIGLVLVVLLLMPLILFMVFGTIDASGNPSTMYSARKWIKTFTMIPNVLADSSLRAFADLWLEDKGEYKLFMYFDIDVVTGEPTPEYFTFKFDNTPFDTGDSWLDLLHPLNIIASLVQRVVGTAILVVHAVLVPALHLFPALFTLSEPIDGAIGIPNGGIWGNDLPESVDPYREVVV